MKLFNSFRSLRHSFAALAVFLFISCIGSGTQAKTSDNQMLFIAVLQGNLVQTEKMLKEGASPETRGVSGNSLLSTACHASNAEMADLLLKYKANPDKPNKDGSIPLNFAFKPVILKKLIDKGANIYQVSKKTGATAFETWCATAWVTTEAEKQEMIKIMKSQKIKVDRAYLEKISWITDKDINEILRLYLQKGYDLNKSFNSAKNMPLHIAASNDNYSLMHKLISAGSRASYKNIEVRDPLNLIAGFPNSKRTETEFKKMLSELLAAGADINTVDSEGDTPLINAADVDNFGKIRVLLGTKGIDIHKTGNYGETVLFRSKNLVTTKLLVTAGLKVNHPNKYNLTPIFNVIDPASVSYLIQKGADVNHVDGDNENALLYNMHSAYDAIRYGSSSEAQTKKYIEKVKILIKSGIDVNCKAKKTNYTALFWAERAEMDKIVDILKKAGARK
ncbi:MAG TPA: hypothetical protein PK419_00480 [Spirochaetota bacterium]|nr:hypothetical protein [Spirochaetota bacterium]HOH37031.1 hypothetical protein [Spirochaetota bacterium]HQA51309.1 hypothetical protein [Spirochaetota bacterium]